MPSTKEKRIIVLIVAGHPFAGEGITAVIAGESDSRVVAETETGREVIEIFRIHRPDAKLMVLQLPEMKGHQAIETIRGEFLPVQSGSRDLECHPRRTRKGGNVIGNIFTR
jgi:DNA-binding NarL/FixJ family response regulator